MNVFIFTFITACIVRYRLGKRRMIISWREDWIMIITVLMVSFIFLKATSLESAKFYMMVVHITKERADVLGILYWMLPTLTNLVLLSVGCVYGFNEYGHKIFHYLTWVFVATGCMLGNMPNFNWYNVNAVIWANNLKSIVMFIVLNQWTIILTLLYADRLVPRMDRRWTLRKKRSVR